MFDDALQKLGDILTPHATSMQLSLSSGLERILSRLDRIGDAVTNEEFLELRKTVNLQLTADTPTELIQTNTGEDWELELITVLGACSLTITESERFRLAKQYNTADFSSTIGLIIRENATLTIQATGNEEPVRVSLQFKRITSKAPTATQSAGQHEPEVLPVGRGVSDISRHTQGISNIGRR